MPSANIVIRYWPLLRRAWALLAPDRALVLMFLFLSMCLALTEGVGVAMIIPIVGVEAGGGAIAEVPVIGRLAAPFFGLPTQERLLLAAAVLAAILLVRGAVQFLTQFLSALLPLRLQRRLATDSYQRLLEARYAFVSRGDQGQTIAQLREFPVMVTGWVRALVDAVIALLLVAAYLALMMLISWPLTLGALAMMGAIFLLLKRVNERWLLPAGHALGDAYARLNTLLQESVLGMRLIRLQCAEPQMLRRFTDTADDLYATNKRLALVQELQSPLSNTLAGLVVCGLLAGGSVLASGQAGGMLAMIAVFIASLYRMLSPAVKVVNSHGTMTMNMAGFEQLDRFQREAAAARENAGGRTFEGLRHGVTFERVAFRYDAAAQPAIADVSFTVAKGRTVAIVGPSGAGKTTLLALVARLYAPSSGRILIDGIDLNELDVRRWRRRLAVVSQGTVLFNDTVAANLAFGLEGVDRAAIEAAARQASADEFIRTLPDGYDTRLGDGGARLSGGQQQRLALARAFLIKPDVLLLDEATSQLDSFTEFAVQKAIADLHDQAAIIVVAHRLSTVQRADEIIVMDNGCIVERGRHAELLGRRGTYWDMLQHQKLDLLEAS